jgi:hypothetical protein
MIQEAGDFLLRQGIIKNRIAASKIVDGSYVQTYLRTRPK